ncbi:MAG: hypothetical protein ACOCRX_01645 [Candidatus Woesearchaeota archaeon]
MNDKYFNSDDEFCLESLLDDVCNFFTKIELEIKDDYRGSVVYNNGSEKKELSSDVYVKDMMANKKPFNVKDVYVSNIDDLEELKRSKLSDLELHIRTNIDQILYENMGVPVDFELQHELDKYINEGSEFYVPINLSNQNTESYLPVYSDKFGGSFY